MTSPPRRVRTVMTWLATVAAIAVGLVAVVWLLQERLIFFPQPLGSTAHLPRDVQPLEVSAADGTGLRGWLVRRTASPAPVVLYFGGNAEEVSWTVADGRWPEGWAVAAVNYRGYGGSEGKPGERELKADALAVYDALVARGDVDPRRIVVFGRSLGTALAAHVAAQRPVAAVILVSPFDSLAAVGGDHYRWLPVSLLLRHRFDALDDARRNRMPLLAIVGGADTIVRPERSRALFDAWAGPKSWEVLPGADHNTLGEHGEFWRATARFLARH